MQNSGEGWTFDYVTADKIVARGKCEISRITVVPSAATTNSAVYDGLDTNGKKIIDLPCAVTTVKSLPLTPPVRCEQGIYVDVGTSVTGILVQYRLLRGRES